MSKLKIYIVLLFSIFQLNCRAQVSVGKSEQPNVLIIFPDQFRRYSSGYWSQPEYRGKTQGKSDPVITPNIDKLAKNGIVFTNAVSNYPLCSPHRGMLMSGMYPEQNGIWSNCRKDRTDALKSDIKAVTDVYFDIGYNVSYFGKCHWINTEPVFDEKGTYKGTTESPGGHYINRYDTYVPPGKDRHSIEYFYQSVVDNHVNPYAYSNDPKTVNGNKDGVPFRTNEFSPKTEARHIRNYIKNNRNQRDSNKPFFLIWAPNPPHAPWDLKNTDMEQYRKHYSEEKVPNLENLVVRKNADTQMANHARSYFSNVTSIDKYIGSVMKELENSGLLENTIVVFSSDHGEMLGSHKLKGKNVIQTEAIAIPLIIHWPKKLKHRIEESFFNVPDLMPTLLGLTGNKKAIPKNIGGLNYSRNLVSKSYKKNKQESALLLLPNSKGIINKQYTLSVGKSKKGFEVFLYDNIKDPYQLKKIKISERKEVAQELLKELGQFLQKTNDPWYQERKFNKIIKYPN